MKQTRKARIVGMGSYLPEKRLTNADLEKMVETSHDWIVERTGVEERRIAAEDEFPSTMGAAAAQQALQRAGISADQIGMVICATATPDFAGFPATASIIQDRIGANNAGAFDLAAACSGHVYGLSVAKAFVESGQCDYVLVVSSEKFSSVLDYTDRTTCILFGDGAAAAVVSNQGAGFEIDSVVLKSDGAGYELLQIPAGGSRVPTTAETVSQKQHYVQMQGRVVFKNAVRQMAQSSIECLEHEGLGVDDIRWVVPHQANVRIIDAVARRLGIPESRVFSECVKWYGNNSAASVAVALDELTQKHTIEEGERILVTVFGAGLTYGALLLKKIDQE